MTPRTGLVVAGAGARGAYEAGALSVLLPRMHDGWSAPSVLVGTSAGAINAAALAGLAHHDPGDACVEIGRRWCDVDLSGVVDLGGTVGAAATGYGARVVGVPRPVLGLLGLADRLTGLLDTSPLRATLEPLVDWDRLHDNVSRGTVDAVAVTATSMSTGGTVVFVERGPGVELPPRDLRRDISYVDARLTVDHLRASAAVPGLFRPVWLDDPPGWYLDGGVRMNTPLKPALRLGCDRIGVVASTPLSPAGSGDPGTPDLAPDVFAAAALTLRIVLGSGVTEDLRTLLALNVEPDERHRRVPAWFAGPPTERAGELAALAAATLHRVRPRRRDAALWLLDRLVGGDAAVHGELLSFLLFDREFAAAAVRLGAEHAAGATAPLPEQ